MNPEHTEDLAMLVTRAGQGEPTAFADLVARFDPLVRGSARRVVTSPQDVEDVVQQTWLILMERIRTIRVPEALPGWLATTARHEALRVVRRNHRSVPTDDEQLRDVQDPDDGPEDRAVRRDLADRVSTALSQMPRDRATFLIHLVAGERTYREAAATLGRPLGSLGPTRARYLEQFSREARSCGAA